LKALSLFSNVGFGEFYLKNLGIDTVFANEIISERCALYSNFHPTVRCIHGDISSLKWRDLIIKSCLTYEEPIDLVIATPPCQGMSGANALKKPDDIRNKLIVYALEIFNTIGAKYMLIENVPNMPHTFINYEGSVIKISDFIKRNLREDFSASFSILDAKNFGTAQSRKRSICLISESGKWQHPKPLEGVLTLRDVISHLPSLQNGEHSSIPWHFASNHNENHVKWMNSTPEGQTAFNNIKDYPQKDGRRIKGFMTTYKRMYWDKPAPTVTMTNGSISSQNNVHPKDPRVLSIRELLCVCGLPEDCLDKFAHLQPDGSYQYDYKPNFIRKVIGEIFLPKMSYSILNTLPRKSFS
jgi:DNA (cytosine-5)-methyltransferase 1